MPASRSLIKLLALVGVTLIYVVSYRYIHAAFGPAGVALSMIIAGMGGWFFGLWGGLVVACLTFPLNIWVLMSVGVDGWRAMIPNGIPGSAAIIFLGGVVGFTRDLSAKLLMELSEKKRLENLYKTLVEASPDTIVRITLDGTITYASEQNLTLYGYTSPQELIGGNAFAFFIPEDRERAKKNMERVVRGDNPGIIEYTLLKKDGSHLAAELSSSLVKDAQGVPVSVVTYIRDITKRKAAERDLLTQKEEYERANRLMIGRELAMKELKEKIKKFEEAALARQPV